MFTINDLPLDFMHHPSAPFKLSFTITDVPGDMEDTLRVYGVDGRMITNEHGNFQVHVANQR